MRFFGETLLAPFYTPTEVTVQTPGNPSHIRLRAKPLDYHCGGSYCGVSAAFANGKSFSFINYGRKTPAGHGCRSVLRPARLALGI